MEIDRADFRKFLADAAALDDGFLVANTCGCPLAAYLHSKSYSRAHVYKEIWIDYNTPDDDYSLPSWAQEFVRLIDEADDTFVSARAALAVLDQIPE